LIEQCSKLLDQQNIEIWLNYFLDHKMSTMNNPLWPSLRNLAKKLNLLNGLIVHLDTQLGSSREKITKDLTEKNLDSSILYTGTRLAITDLSDFRGGCYFLGPKEFMFEAKGEKYYQMIDELIWREAAWTVAQGYESFKTFIDEITASYLLNYIGEIEKKLIKKLDNYNRRIDLAPCPTEFSYWIGYARFIGCKDALALLRRIDSSQSIVRIEQQNSRKINLVEWINAAYLVRNATVHEITTIPIREINKWPKRTLDMLVSCFPGIYKENGYILQLNVKHAQDATQMFAEYAYIIFRSVSLLQGYKFEFTESEINFL
jgi:hypothetical protein